MNILYQLVLATGKLMEKKIHELLVQINKHALRAYPTRCCDRKSDDYLASFLLVRDPRYLEAEVWWTAGEILSDPKEGYH